MNILFCNILNEIKISIFKKILRKDYFVFLSMKKNLFNKKNVIFF